MIEKQKLYLEILGRILPFMRNIQTHSRWQRFKYGSFYPEMELVHNLPMLLIVPHFTEHDIHWLNAQAKIFFKHGQRNDRWHRFYQPVTAVIGELFSLVPEPLKRRLVWDGPPMMSSKANK